jgi:hypothetical protein
MTALNVTAVLSMLHEPAGRPNSATRRFRGEAPLAWTLYRLRRSQRISKLAVVCWEDQLAEAGPIAQEMQADCFGKSPRKAMPPLDAVAAARRWADGWRGALLGACEFDRGFHGSWFDEILKKSQGDAAFLADPSAGLIDPVLIDSLIDHAARNPEVDLCFSQAPPGLSGVLLRKALLDQIASGTSHPGTLLSYRPDLPMRDLISTPACAPLATPLARTSHRFTLDSERQIDRINDATIHLNGQLIHSEAEQLLRFLDDSLPRAAMPREVVLELSTRRAARPIFWPGSFLQIDRPDLKRDVAKKLFEELAPVDDIRLVLGGVGDPLLHLDFQAILDDAHRAGIGAIAIETDLIGIDAAAIEQLADSPLDIISVNLPAFSSATYQAVMGVDAGARVMENLARLIHRRQSQARGTPLIVPTFVKTAVNLAEMEAWYDHWLRILGCAVIAGPSDFSGQIPDASVAQMEPPLRKACARIAQRLTVLCDGRVVSCEQDVLGRQILGRIGEDSIKSIWSGAAGQLRADHAAGNWQSRPLCAACHDWHRP